MSVDVDTQNREIRASRPLRRSGNSVVVSLPPELLREAQLEEGDEVSLVTSFDGAEISIQAADESDE